MSAEPNIRSGAENLQFDRAVDPDSAANTGSPVCATCNAAIRMYYYDIDGATACSSCKQAVERTHGGGAGKGPGMLKALLFGLGAAIAGSVIYFSVMKYLELEIGYVAILIGFMVGYAVRNAVAGRGGRRFQLLAAGLTYFAVALAYAPFSVDAMREAASENAADSATVAASGESADAAASASTDASADGTTEVAEGAPAQQGLGAAGIALGIGGGLLFVLLLPIVVIVGSMPSGLISALIIGLGMHTAWSMTRKIDVNITGPFKVGGERAPAAA